MAANKIFTFGPVALTTTLTTNILNCAITSLAGPVGITLTQPYIILRSIHVVNKTTSTAAFSLWRGATGANAAGTELWVGKVVPANDVFADYGLQLCLGATDFLVGGSGTATALTIYGTGEIGFV